MQRFIWGVATSSYQIEGGADLDGRSKSIWDTFCEEGKVKNGDNGNTACQHYQYYKEDIKYIKDLGVDSYRFSIAWPRIFPEKGVYNAEGMNFYRNIISELKKNGISACVTLYHWDLPQWAQNEGGWENRESVNWFIAYADKCFAELDNDVEFWITHNEPWCASILSNLLGIHAPGKTDVKSALKVAHHLLLSHGESVKLYRKKYNKNQIGITLNLTPTYPYQNNEKDIEAALIYDGTFNRWFLDPVFYGQYPKDIYSLYANMVDDLSFIKEEDLIIIKEEIDFLGVNYYYRSILKHDDNPFGYEIVPFNGYKTTFLGWEIAPNELKDVINQIRESYTKKPIMITENGSCWDDRLNSEKVNDEERIDYLKSHVKVIKELNENGSNITGYYYWSLLDNFEWAEGYDKRFGLVYVDFATQKRYIKDSFNAYKKIIEENQTITL